MPNRLSFLVFALAVVAALRTPASLAAGSDPIDDLAATSRESQMAAVEALVAQEAHPGGALIELWRSTERPDVHAMIARVLAGRGESAFDTILALADRGALEAGGYGLDLLGWAVAERGDGALEAVLGAVRNERAHADLVALYTIDHLGLDRVALGFELAQSESHADRSFAHHRLLFDAPAPRVSALLVRLAESEEKSDRHVAAMHLPRWSMAERAADPAGYEAVGMALAALLEDDDSWVRSSALRTLRDMDPIPPQAGPVLRAMVERGEPTQSFVESPLELFMQIERGPEESREAFAFALDQMGTQPDRVALALQYADRDLLTPAVLRQLMAAAEPEGQVHLGQVGRLLGRVPTVPGYEFLVEGTIWEGDPQPLGLAVLPEIVAWLVGEDRARSGEAVRLLNDFGPAAAAVLPELIATYDAADEPRRRVSTLRAAIAVAPGDPRVRERVLALPTAPAERAVDDLPRVSILEAVAEHAIDQPWARDVVGPLLRDPSRRESSFLVAVYGEADAGLIAMDPSAHVAALLAEDAWQTEAYPRAARALGLLEHPSDEAIDALARAVRDEPMGHWPRNQFMVPGGLRDAEEERLKLINRRVMEAWPVAEALATLLDRRPERIGPAIDILVGDINALAAVLSVPLPGPSDGESRVLAVPEAVGPERIALALDALLVRAERLAEQPREPQTHLYALAALPTDDPRRLQALLHLARFGPGPAVNAIATGVLGRLRPVTPEVLEELRAVLTGPPTGRLQAAVLACARLGPLAGPLLDDLLAVAEQGRPLDYPWLAPMALLEVAPDDPRVRAAAEPWPELLEAEGDR